MTVTNSLPSTGFPLQYCSFGSGIRQPVSVGDSIQHAYFQMMVSDDGGAPLSAWVHTASGRSTHTEYITRIGHARFTVSVLREIMVEVGNVSFSLSMLNLSTSSFRLFAAGSLTFYNSFALESL